MLFTYKPKFVDTLANILGLNVILDSPQIINYSNPIINDTFCWVKISSLFLAKGGEQYITIGNFKNDNQTTTKISNPTGVDQQGYYIDDVSVIPLDSFCLKANAGRDTTIKAGDSVFIGSYTNGIDTIKWYNAAGQVIDSLQPGFWIKPSITGSYMYMIEQTVNGCYSRDTMYINVVLPLRIMNYSVSLPSPLGEGLGVRSSWQTTNEINVSHFNIQRSKNGKYFTTIAQQKAQNKALNNYSYTDETIRNEQQEAWFYRIESIDNDGKKSYSEIKKVSINQLPYQSISIYPNPVKDYVNIVSNNLKTVELLSAYGQVLTVKQAYFNRATINTSKLSNGIYLLKVTNQDGTVTIKKIIK
jgi:Secretion system C-terminal sorting domain